jgi:hypothetical protein
MLRWLTTVVVSDVEKAAGAPSGGDQGCVKVRVIMVVWCGDTPRLAFSRPGW